MTYAYKLVTIFSVVAISISPLTASSTHGIDLSPLGLHAVDKPEKVSPLNFQNLHSYDVVRDKLIVKLGSRTGPDTEIHVYDANTLVELWSISGPCHYHNASEGNQPSIVFVRIRDEDWADYRVYDLSGEFLFSKSDHVGEIFPSPNGQYFYSGSSLGYIEAFKVFDRNGLELPFFQGEIHLGQTIAFNDTVVVYIDTSIIQFLSVPEGKLIKSISIPQTNYSDVSNCEIASNGDHLILSWTQKTVYIVPSMDILWSVTDSSYVINAAFTENGEYVALYQIRQGDYKLTLINTGSGETVWSEQVPVLVNDGHTRYYGVEIIGDIIRVLNPQSEYLVRGILAPETQTFLYRIDPSDGKLIGSVSAPGVTLLANTPNGLMSFTVEADDPNNIVAKRWINDQNDK